MNVGHLLFNTKKVNTFKLKYFSAIITRTASEKLVECGLPSSADKVLVFQFGSFTYAKCECNMILYLIYSHLVRHAKGAGKYDS